MNSFIRWIGGKQQLKREIIKRFPDEKIKKYIEVFGGAGWVLFDKERHAEIEVFNDIDSNLINLYRCVKYHCGAVQEELSRALNAREYFEECKELINRKNATDIQRAAAYFVLIKLSFGADRRSYGLKNTDVIQITDFLSKAQKRLKRVIIENRSYEKIIKCYDSADSLFYLDPPYIGAESYYSADFEWDDHIRLKEVLDGIQGRFILSYNDSEKIERLYQKYKIERVERRMMLFSGVNTSPYRELIIKNYE